MPKPRIGIIPPTRLTTARKVRDTLNAALGSDGYAVVSICRGGYSVLVRLFEGVRNSVPDVLLGIPIKVTRVRK